MKKSVLLLLILCCAFGATAQQEQHYTQFMYNKLLINPGYAGARGVGFVTAIYRSQWMGFDGAPKSALASFNSPFLRFKRVGVGITLSHYQIGLNKDFSGTLAYSYDLIGTEEMSLRAGIMGSIRSLAMNISDGRVLNGNPSTDPSLGSGANISNVYANVGAGLYATFIDRFYLGVSVPRMYSNNLSINNNQPAQGFQLAKEYQHFYCMAGAVLDVSEDIKLLPAVLAKYVKNAPFDMDVNVNLEIGEKITAGLSYRVGGDGPGESMDLLVFWKAHPQFGIGVAYDFTLSDVKDYSSGSIEMMLQVDLKQSGKRKISNPRFFM